MKKILLFTISFLVLSGLASFAVITRDTQEIYTPIFISRFLKCIPCKMEQTIVTEKGTIRITRLLKNWKDHKCRYSESYTTEDNKTETFSCNLSREQVNTLTSAMKADPQNKADALKAWTNVKKDETTCQISE
ncbi:MAG: hypothetical protein E7Z93_03870 [Cyanobacteria bacterium SIG32]|nr:hypothetical protein [Cyanobacteria bacterium SIG32]